MKGKKKQIIISVVVVVLLVLITIGVTYAIFISIQSGSTENTVTAGTLKFLYTENTGVGAGINLTDALPVSDIIGKSYTTEGKVFDFNIQATNTGTEYIPYEVTLRKKNNSTLEESAIKVYLTDMTEDTDSELLTPTLYSNLTQTKIEVGEEIEKTIYTNSVPGGQQNYLKKFRLRMWIDENISFLEGNYNNKTFTATVNIYSNALLAPETNGISIFGKKFEVIEETPNLTNGSTTCEVSRDSGQIVGIGECTEIDTPGLYKSTLTNSGNPTYYFRGNVENNYVSFAGYTWRIIRINEDGTIRVIAIDSVNIAGNGAYADYNVDNNKYYSNSITKLQLESWYQTNIVEAGLSDKVEIGEYFCEQEKVTGATYSSYTPNFKCEDDVSGYGLINNSVGLITYDEMVYAGFYPGQVNANYIGDATKGITSFWTMSPSGSTSAWYYSSHNSSLTSSTVYSNGGSKYPVINLKADTITTGSGTSTDMFIVK